MIKKILYGFILLLCFLLIGLSEFIVADFDTSIFTSAKYWYSLIASFIANALMLYSTSTKDIDDYETKDKIIVEKKEELNKLVTCHVENDFDKYLSEENIHRKIYAWKQKINNKLSKLERFAKSKDIELYHSNNEELKVNNKYCQKRLKLEQKLTPEYVDTHLYYLRVKYHKLKRYEITTGCKQKDEEYQLTTNKYSKIIIDNLPRFAFSFGLILFASSFIPDIAEFNIAIVITFVIKLLSLCLNLLNGKSYATYFKNYILLPDLQYRNDKVISYLTWKINNKQTNNDTNINTGGVNNATNVIHNIG